MHFLHFIVDNFISRCKENEHIGKVTLNCKK